MKSRILPSLRGWVNVTITNFDDQLSLDAQINAVSQICYLNQRNLSRVGSKLSHERFNLSMVKFVVF